MRLENLIATPHPDGNRIDLSWTNPEVASYPGVRVMRRISTYPRSAEDGVLVASLDLNTSVDEKGRALYEVADTDLQGEVVYYYSLFPFHGDPPVYDIDRTNRTATMATTRHDMDGQLIALLPAIYRRYDAAGRQHDGEGPLRRFLKLPGGQLDQVQSFARALYNLCHVDEVDGRLLPLLADWIGWKTDSRLELEAQRRDVHNAPAIYKSIGLIPTVESTVKRISGWESRSKEFVHNVLRTNQPPRLNLWMQFPEDTAGALLSLDEAYDGRPTAVTDADGVHWLLYHTRRRNRWQIWYKTLSVFTLNEAFRDLLDDGVISTELHAAFEATGFTLSQDAAVTALDDGWLLADSTQGERYSIRDAVAQLNVYRWTPSKPFADEDEVAKYPVAALQGSDLWVFWSVMDSTTERWRIRYRRRSGGVWTEGDLVFPPGSTDQQPERKLPAVMVDEIGGLWLFWLERLGRGWAVRYNRHDGVNWDLTTPSTFPLDGAAAPRVAGDLFVLFHPNDAARPIWVFWARKETTSQPGQTRWTITFRTKGSIEPTNTGDWSVVHTLPKDDEDAHDREPMVAVDPDDNLTVYWSANRNGSWSIWRATLNLAGGGAALGTAEALTNSSYEQRVPVVLDVMGGPLVIYRSNESLRNRSALYGATETVDFRYAGARTVDTRNAGLIAERGAFDDFQTYLHQSGTQNDDWYRRDTLGLYLTPDTMDTDAVDRGVTRIAQVLPEFMPTTDRAVFVTERDLHIDYVYSYEESAASEPTFIGESYGDVVTAVLATNMFAGGGDFLNELE